MCERQGASLANIYEAFLHQGEMKWTYLSMYRRAEAQVQEQKSLLARAQKQLQEQQAQEECLVEELRASKAKAHLFQTELEGERLHVQSAQMQREAAEKSVGALEARLRAAQADAHSAWTLPRGRSVAKGGLLSVQLERTVVSGFIRFVSTWMVLRPRMSKAKRASMLKALDRLERAAQQAIKDCVR